MCGIGRLRPKGSESHRAELATEGKYAEAAEHLFYDSFAIDGPDERGSTAGAVEGRHGFSRGVVDVHWATAASVTGCSRCASSTGSS